LSPSWPSWPSDSGWRRKISSEIHRNSDLWMDSQWDFSVGCWLLGLCHPLKNTLVVGLKPSHFYSWKLKNMKPPTKVW
jgi:hypothetical protein